MSERILGEQVTSRPTGPRSTRRSAWNLESSNAPASRPSSLSGIVGRGGLAWVERGVVAGHAGGERLGGAAGACLGWHLRRPEPVGGARA